MIKYILSTFILLQSSYIHASYIDYDLFGVWANYRHERALTFIDTEKYMMGDLGYCTTYGQYEYDARTNTLTLHKDGCKNMVEDHKEYRGYSEFRVKILLTPGYIRYIMLYDKKSGKRVYGPLYFQGEK